ncbi:N-acetylglucosamine-1-phosphotransferase subunits alpha/beta [Armadillidium nasatum]|uniref:N-acetylglucosamine-1-phosphotransferase subunits alpha/beta n=1 Tax=Armadillidium nasatum TaxID=96803 RepID=A0A5N5TC38_9CRUS|nr:N-acetylglucosamine-1-phosphotransferase subunits alpha/beta [Armadillidium nasatum]
MKFRKWFHRWILDSLLKNPPPIAFLLICVFGTVFSIGFWCAHWIDEVNLSKYSKLYDVFSDNIGGYSGLNHLRDLLPIDVVYTWVNGSDPLVMENIKKFMKFKVSDCSSFDCIESSYFTVELSSAAEIQAFNNGKLNYIQSFTMVRGNVSKIFVMFSKNDNEDTKNILDQLKEMKPNSSIAQAFWTRDNKIEWSVLWDRALMIRIDSSSNVFVEVSDVSPNNFEEFTKKCRTKSHFGLALIECSETDFIQKLKIDFENYQSKSEINFPKVWHAYLVLHSQLSLEEIDRSRYEDNEELRYSLRSIEKFAPWVRRIYLVTNGQIPNWLNLDHPRLSIVTHNEIFPDLSHLPTFSSPAIESHIHRISGLSEHFLYLNDDILLGDKIHPNDFYSSVSGYKVYLSWFIPDCADGCPGTWLGDSYCDQSCNTSSCFWDGGDCTKPKDQQRARDESLGVDDDGDDMNNFMEDSEFCAPSCSFSWLADTYCDSACNIRSCGFDAGDCGSRVIKENSYRLPVNENMDKNAVLKIPRGEQSAWIDTSSIVNKGKNETLKGSCTNSKGLIVTSFNIPLDVIVFVLKHNSSGVTEVELLVTDKSNKKIKEICFRLEYNTIPLKIHSETTEVNKTPFNFQNYSFDIVSPKILSNKILYKNEIHHNDTTFTKEELLKLLNERFSNGELTQNGFKELERYLNSGGKENKVIESQLGKRKILNVNSKMVLEDIGGFELSRPVRSTNFDIENPRSNLFSGRGLLDEFRDSLIFVNQLYNTAYGFQGRKVPAHMPHFINKDIFQKLYDRSHIMNLYSSEEHYMLHYIYREFQMTSSHKIRQGNDMQYAFSYFYYLQSEKRERSFEEIFDEYDTDKSGTWSDREIRTLLTKLYDLPLQLKYFTDIHNDIRNCSDVVKPKSVPVPPYERYADSDVVRC